MFGITLKLILKGTKSACPLQTLAQPINSHLLIWLHLYWAHLHVARHTMNSFFREFRRWRSYHSYFKRTGFYEFIYVNALKILLILAILIALFLLFQNYIIEYRPVVESWLQGLRWGAVFLVFLLTESFLGLLPPDFFIVWAQQFIYPYLAVSGLALVSFTGSTISYFIGLGISRNNYVREFLGRRYTKFFRLLKQWGGLFIVAAALFPLPYSLVCILIGMVKYPFRRFMLYGSARILRFYIYAVVLFALIK